MEGATELKELSIGLGKANDIRVESFSGNDWEVTRDINNWFSSNKQNVEVVDIKLSTSTAEAMVFTTALVIYKIK